MATLDIILLVCLIPFVIRGIMKGFISQVVALASLILGAWLSFKFSDRVCTWIEPYLEVSPQVLNIIAFVLILVVVIIGLNLLGKMLQGLLKLVMLGWADRLLGLVFALATGVPLVGLGVMLLDTLNVRFGFISEETLESSVLYSPLKDIANTVFPYIKEWLLKK